MSIDKIIIENFKIFEGQHIFSLNELNILTGANNSGKSTLFKAITLFSRGLDNGDFPVLNLFDDNLGEFDDIVNNNSNSDNFNIGFYIKIGESKHQFKVLYKFVKGGDKQNDGIAQFANFEILDCNNNLLFGVYNIENNRMSIEDFEFDVVDNEKNLYEFPFKTPSRNGDAGILYIKFSIDILEKYLPDITKSDFSQLIAQMKSISGRHNNWYGEQFYETNFHNDLSILTLNDLVRDIIRDKFCNMADFITKDAIYWGKENEDFYYNEYEKLKDEIKYSDFLKSVIVPMFNAVGAGLEIFRKRNIASIKFYNFEDRVLTRSRSNEYLFTVKNDVDNFNSFVRKSLKLFNIDGYVELKSHLNSALEVNLVTGLDDIDKQIIIKYKDTIYPYLGCFDKKYKNAVRQNIKDLGKGTSNLIGIILKIFSVFEEHDNRKRKNEEIRRYLGYEPKNTYNKLILIEEPEVFLHPDWQSKLADFFVLCINHIKSLTRKLNIIFLIETHSEYIIRRFQYLVAKQEIDTNSLSIYYLNNLKIVSSSNKQINRLTIRPDGLMDDDFGSGFLDESTKLTVDLLKTQNQN